VNPTGADFLARIADDRRRRVEESKQRVPAYLLRERLSTALPCGRLERALRRGAPSDPLRLLCEIKRASPSKGMLRADLDPVAMARTYASGGASAISIVTEPDHFLGDAAWVDAVRPTTRLPILLKDFVVDAYQILDAAVRGADGVLLLAALLSDVQLQILISDARLHGLDALVEVHDENELHTALRAGATLLGINNRDLRTFRTSLATTERLLPGVPRGCTVVAESGIETRADMARLIGSGVHAFLVGETLMRAPDPGAKLMELRGAQPSA
jgi:indole-3-glycerol phosphate synthase